MAQCLPVILIGVFVFSTSGTLGNGCQSPQYLAIGETGVIHCRFRHDFYGVLWYDSAEPKLQVPLIKLIASEKSGDGYYSGKYDVFPNGSLIIKNVSYIHDQTFTAVEFSSAAEDPVQFDINVTTTVKPERDHPLIDACGSDRGSCYALLGVTSVINCYIRGIRPEVNLEWFARTSEGDQSISFATNVTHDGITYTSHASISNLFHIPSVLRLFGCKADSPPEVLRENEMFVLIENGDISTNVQPRDISIARGHELKLVCSRSNADLIVWKKKETVSGTFDILCYAVFLEGKFSQMYSDDYQLNRDGSLFVPYVEMKHEAIYECSFGNGKHLLNVKVNDQRSNGPESRSTIHYLWLLVLVLVVLVGIDICFCLAHRRGCRMVTRPKEKTVGKESKESMNEENVSMIQEIVEPPQSGCRMVTRPKEKTVGKESKESINEENVSMIQETVEPGQSENFIGELKANYKIQYESIKPIPSEHTDQFNVNDVFVECGYRIQRYEFKENDSQSWEFVRSYKDVLNRISSSSVAVIEGDPGSGKSTLTLQLVYDWCNNIETSPLRNKDIVILLKMRALEGVTSLYTAIKSILPEDTTFTEVDIEENLRSCKSGVIILDGYDETPDLQKDFSSNFFSIVNSQMFQDYLFLVTTRSFFLLKSLPRATYRIKITGFTKEIQDEYICKVVAKHDFYEREEIKQWFLGMSNLDLIQVPLVFTMFAHMGASGRERFEEFLSLSTVLRLTIDCFNNHTKNKMEHKDFEKVEKFVQEHAVLDEMAFQSFNKKQTCWDRDELSRRIGEELLKYYLQTGIFVETEKCIIEERPVQLGRRVGFYCGLFLEWYAAHFFSSKVKQSAENLKTFVKDSQVFHKRYILMFACGIDGGVGKTITEFLKGKTDCQYFETLCSLGITENIKTTLSNIREGIEVTIDKGQDTLKTWSVMQLAAFALRNDIPIKRLNLKNALKFANFSPEGHSRQSQFHVPVLHTMKHLEIHDEEQTIESEKAKHILLYASKCKALQSLSFCKCRMPMTIMDECLSILKLKQVTVLWKPYKSRFHLDLQLGTWKFKGTPISEEKYWKEINSVLLHASGAKSRSLHGGRQ